MWTVLLTLTLSIMGWSHSVAQTQDEEYVLLTERDGIKTNRTVDPKLVTETTTFVESGVPATIDLLVVVDLDMKYNSSEEKVIKFLDIVLSRADWVMGQLKNPVVKLSPLPYHFVRSSEEQTFYEAYKKNFEAYGKNHTLYGFGNWIYQNRGRLPGHDIAMFVTNTHSKGTNLGMTFQSSVCDTANHADRTSWAVAWVELNIPRKRGERPKFRHYRDVAHELGHLLGGDHDHSTDCWRSSNVMSRKDQGLRKFTWSTCAQKAISDFLHTKLATCLWVTGNPVPPEPFTTTVPPYPDVPSFEQQCVMVTHDENSKRADIFFSNWRVRTGNELCDTLPCTRPSYPGEKRHTSYIEIKPMEGTHCGTNQRFVCKSGKCIKRR